MLFIVSVTIFCSANASSSLYGNCIYLDPGHGGADPGATYGGVEESDINLEIAFKLKEKLENKGAIVYLTRDGDYDLSSGARERKRNDLYKRSVLINNSGCDLYLSLHLNAASKSNWQGAQVFYDDVNSENVVLARIIQTQLRRDFGTKRRVSEVKNGFLYKRVKIPGALVEMGFLSNPYERSKLKNSSYQDKLANSLSTAIENYLKNKKK